MLEFASDYIFSGKSLPDLLLYNGQLLFQSSLDEKAGRDLDLVLTFAEIIALWDCNFFKRRVLNSV